MLRAHRLRAWLPPEALRLANHWSGRTIRLSGDYPSWEEASRHAEGYDAASILKRAQEATLAVRDGKAAFERDGVTFATAQPPLPLIAGLLLAAACDRGQLRVVDFGGALGSTYYQCRAFFDGLALVRWQVVEQPHFAARGAELFASDVLGFSSTISEAARAVTANAIVLSSVLQYLPDPGKTLRELAMLGARVILIDRTPVIDAPRDAIAVQTVSSRIVRSSYPVRLFARANLLAPLSDRYRLLAEFDAVDLPMGGMLRRVEFKGFLLEANPRAVAPH